MRKQINYALFALILLICSCADENKSSNKQFSKPDVTKKNTDSSTILGCWIYGDDEYASFAIEKDSIYYPDKDLRYPYKRDANKMIIYTDTDCCDTLNYWFNGSDTLKFIKGNNITVYTKNKTSQEQ